MAATESRASWHPAFMPNSTSDFVSSNVHQSSYPNLVPDETFIDHTASHEVKLPESVSSHLVDLRQEVIAENTPAKGGKEHMTVRNGDRESGNIRSVLTAPLERPDAFEAGEHPIPDGQIASGGSDAPEDRFTIPQSAEYSPESHAHEPGHTSSASFARTVPRDIDWEEEGDVDPEWNLHKTKADPFKLMAPVDRSNSFPQVPPAHNVASTSLDHALPKSQAGEIISRVEQTQNFFSEYDATDGFFGNVAGGDETPSAGFSGETEKLFQTSLGGIEASDYGMAYSGGVMDEPQAQLRYEEGLPLVGEIEPVEGQTKESENANLTFFAESGSNESDDFFGNLAGSESSKASPPLGRKSTMQVINAFNFQPPEHAPADALDIFETRSSEDSLDQDADGSVAVSRSPVLAQVVAEIGNELSSQENGLLSPHEPGNEDLAARWKAALAGDELLGEDELLDDDAIVEDNAVDPATLFGSDDEGFLDDDEPTSNHSTIQQVPPSPAPVIGSDGRAIGVIPQTSTSSSRYLPQGATEIPAQHSSNTFIPQAPLLTDLSTQPGRSSLPVDAGFGFGIIPTPLPSYGAPQQNIQEATKSQSFADKSKGGYSSPYDLPMEVVKPKKRASIQQVTHGHSNAAPPGTIPPPRSSSMVTQRPPPSRGSASSMSPPGSSPSLHQGPVKSSKLPASTTQQTGSSGVNSSAGFFAELPVASKPKPAGRYTPQPAPSTMGEQKLQSMPTTYHLSQSTITRSTPAIQKLVAPPKVSPFAPLPTSQPQPPFPTTRYSPAAVHSDNGNAPPPVVGPSRYAVAPHSQQQPSSSYSSTANAPLPSAPVLAHQPRTSSPLIHFERAPDQYSASGSGTENGNTETFRRESSDFGQTPRTYFPQDRVSPSKRVASNYTSDYRSGNIHREPPFVPPQRSRTQSPGKVMASSHIEMSVGEPYQRPLSAHSPTSPHQVKDEFPSISSGVPKPQMRGASQSVNYIAPTDGREHDPLQRWRGCPIFAWGVGGTVVTSFPKEIPRYGMGQPQPMILCSLGEVKVCSLKDIYNYEERLASFPGPLKGKSKKKDVIAWLTVGIEALERETDYLGSLTTLTHEDKRKEERLLLLKILRIMVENDGLLEGTPVVNKAVRGVLSPDLESEGGASAPRYTTGFNLSGTPQASASTTLPEPVNPAAIEQLRKHLLLGEREKAVWEAVDKRLWAHALLISNTLSREVHKQVAQEFIQKEVKGIGENMESLAALYEIFAGNFEESVDELVPPSARAGLRMVSTSGTSGSSKSSLDGLDRWRETLGLVLSNRSPEDFQAINALGRLLSGYGRAEAAHICFLFARGYSVFSGVDDPSANIVLVGADHLRQPYDFDKELELILLTEVYEYGLSLSATSNVSYSTPHLAIYKLQHASILAELGQRDKALQYCDAIASSITSQVRRSPYHHSLLIAALDDLSKRLKQSPKDESSSWISKPSIDKVSGSLWGKFNKFVAGEDDTGSGGAGSEAGSEVGPFARIAGDTPVISRPPSNNELHGLFGGAPANGSTAHLPSLKPTSRYAPGGSYTPPGAQDPSLSASYGSPPQGSYMQKLSQEDLMRQEGHGPEGVGFGYQHRFNEQMPRSYPDSAPSLPSSSYEQSGSPYLGTLYTPQHPTTQIHDQYASLGLHDSPHSVPASESDPLPFVQSVTSSYEPPSLGTYDTQSSGGYELPSSRGYEPLSSGGYEPPSSGGYEPPSDGGYEPPSSGGYEPPSYEPAPMNDEPDSPIDTKPRKRSSIDDDADAATTNPAAEINASETTKKEKSKAEKDREADEAFRKAVEADAKKDDVPAPAKKGWGLGSWFSRKETAAGGTQPSKPIRAKLGEESSFVYDPELKRWINKKSGKDGTQERSLSTPPPPTAGPPRSVSASPAMEPTSIPKPISGSAPPKRAVSESASSTQVGQSDGPSVLAIPAPMSRSVSNGSAAGPPSGPPSRPTTSMSNASSIDDLLGPPTARKGTAKRQKRGRGYIDVMEKAST